MSDFSATMGTTPFDIIAVRTVLMEADGWSVEEVSGDAPWIAARGPDGASWAIGRQGGAFFAVVDNGAGAGWDGLASAWDAACFAADAGRPA